MTNHGVSGTNDAVADVVMADLIDDPTAKHINQTSHVNAAKMNDGVDPSKWSFRRDGHVLTDTGRPFILEVFAGSSRLTKELRSAGLDAWAIDWKGGKLLPETPVIIYLNLTIADDIASFRRLLRHPGLMYVHFAPPCGTCSRARGIPLSNGKPGPPPLRSEEHPWVCQN